jgi:signal transduction histidine kinase/CheY-like chemotaxis protein
MTVKSLLHILYLEDDAKDAELVQATLEAAGVACEVTRVVTQPEFFDLLERGGFDLILADYTLPSFDGISALKIAKEVRPEVPFIFVSGTLGEEVAIEALKIGATDYVFKTGLSRIVPSVQRALREAEERSERKRAEEALRRNEAFLAEAQRLSHTGSFGWHVSSGEIYWSEETFRIFDFERRSKPTLERAFERIHPEDRPLVRQTLDSASQERKDLDFEHRLLMPDGSVKYVRIVGHPSTRNESRNVEFVGAVTDITAAKQAEERIRQNERELRTVQAELAHVTRVATVGEMTASIAHEVNQPLAAVVTNAGACLRWLAAQPPEMEEARQALGRIVKDGNRAGEVMGRIRALVKKSPPQKDRLDINETILELILLTDAEVRSNRISLQTQLSKGLPPILGDRIQLQQVILNLIKNAIEAIAEASDGPRELLVSSGKDESKGVLVVVRDSGPGLDPETLVHLFDPFYTTKPEGMGMGLAISRSIIEAHGGRLWAAPNEPHGAIFQFRLPAEGDGTS